ncbi:MAG: helix-turn-helix domain-containing protein [Alphaproteobacteria bacterium]
MSTVKRKTRASDLDKEIGARLSAMRRLKGMSQSELGEKLDLTFQQIQKYESGKNRISTSTLITICNIFQVTPNSFASGIDSDVDESVNILANDEILDLVRECQALPKDQLQAVIKFLKGIKK